MTTQLQPSAAGPVIPYVRCRYAAQYATTTKQQHLGYGVPGGAAASLNGGDIERFRATTNARAVCVDGENIERFWAAANSWALDDKGCMEGFWANSVLRGEARENMGK